MQPYLSIGIRYGGMKLQGKEYVYLPKEDAFLRKDYVKTRKKYDWQAFLEYVKTIDEKNN